MNTTFYSQRLKRRDKLGDLDIDGMIILEFVGTVMERVPNDGFLMTLMIIQHSIPIHYFHVLRLPDVLLCCCCKTTYSQYYFNAMI
jgi:hypothetical protein